MIKITGVGITTEPRDINGVKTPPIVVEHPQGVPNGEDKGKFFVNYTTGELKGIKQPYVNVYLTEFDQGDLATASAVLQWYGENTVANKLDSPIVWQRKVAPIDLFDLHYNFGIVEAAVLFAIIAELSREDWNIFNGLTNFGIKRELIASGVPIKPIGQFFTLPNRMPQFAHMFLKPFEVRNGDSSADSSTQFVLQNDLLLPDGTYNVDGIGDTFAKAGRIIQDSTKNHKAIYSRELLAAKQNLRVARGAQMRVERLATNGSGNPTRDEKEITIEDEMQLPENAVKYTRMKELNAIADAGTALAPEQETELEDLSSWYESVSKDVAVRKAKAVATK